MARPHELNKPVKVTLYIPGDTISKAKDYVAAMGTSVSRLVTDLLEKEVSGTIRMHIDVPPWISGRLQTRAKNEDTPIQDIITKLLDEGLRN